MRFHNTKHSSRRVEDRELSLENIKNVVKYPDEVLGLRRGTHGGIVKKFSKKVDGLTMIVVAEIYRNDCWILTSYYA